MRTTLKDLTTKPVILAPGARPTYLQMMLMEADTFVMDWVRTGYYVNARRFDENKNSLPDKSIFDYGFRYRILSRVARELRRPLVWADIGYQSRHQPATRTWVMSDTPIVTLSLPANRRLAVVAAHLLVAARTVVKNQVNAEAFLHPVTTWVDNKTQVFMITDMRVWDSWKTNATTDNWKKALGVIEGYPNG